MDHQSFEETLKYAAELPLNSAIFLFQMQLDSAGVVHEGDTALRRLYAVANAPIFSTDEAFFGRELVGGPMHSVAVNTERAVAVAVRLLGGESAANIKLPPSNFAPPKFDWRELQRWHISESSLPPGSEVHFRVPTVWDQYRWQTILVMALFLAQAGIIARLFYEQRRRRKAEIESRQRMSELAHMNRYATAGELSASIAHELNQPLGAILNNAEVAEILLNARSTNLDDIKVVIAEIKRDDQRASEVIKRLRRLLTKTEVQIQDIDLNETIQEVFEFLSVQARSRDVVLSIALSPETVRVKGDRIQLQQVILNLVVNAMDAMAGGRTPERKIIGMTMLVDGSAQLSIADCGPGIPSDKIPHLFEPFFTTKQHGMGMGLSIARTIVEAHGGRIWAENHTGGGAIFQLSLPLAEAR
jgi:signal transduction histidine kinase